MKNFNPKQMARRIRILMSIFGTNQDGLARIFGVHKSAISNYLKGTRIPSTEVLVKIVTEAERIGEYQITLDWLIFGQNEGAIKDRRTRHGDSNIEKVVAILKDSQNSQITTSLPKLNREQKNILIKLIEQMLRGG